MHGSHPVADHRSRSVKRLLPCAIGLAVVALSLTSDSAQAAAFQWIAVGDPAVFNGSYGDKAHWGPNANAVPADTDDVAFAINNNNPFTVVLDKARTAKSMKVDDKTHMVLDLKGPDAKGRNYTVTGALTMDGLFGLAALTKLQVVNNAVVANNNGVIPERTFKTGSVTIGTVAGAPNNKKGGILEFKGDKVNWINDNQVTLGDQADTVGRIQLSDKATGAVTGEMIIGSAGDGQLFLESGGKLNAKSAKVGSGAGKGFVSVTGPSVWTLADSLTIGPKGEVIMAKGAGGQQAVIDVKGDLPALPAAQATVIIENGGKLIGEGKVITKGLQVNKKVLNKGKLSMQEGSSVEFGPPPPPPAPPKKKKISVQGNYEEALSATVDISIGRDAAGLVFSDTFQVLDYILDDQTLGGSAQLAGTLEVTFLEGFSPSELTAGQRFVIGYFESGHSGAWSFDNYSLGNNLFVELRYRAHQLRGTKAVLAVVSTVPGPGPLALLGCAGLVGARGRRRALGA